MRLPSGPPRPAGRIEAFEATYSPITLAYPDATICGGDDTGLERVQYEDAEPVRLTQSFLEARGRFLARLLAD